jgi:hypothetical protein
MSTKLKVDKKRTMQVRIDAGIHKLLKMRAAEFGGSIKSLLEAFAVEGLGPINEKR